MIFGLPCGVLTVQKMQQLLPSNFLARRFDQERAASSRTNQGVDLPEQVFWQQHVGAFGVHMCLTSVPSLCAFVNPRFGHTINHPQDSVNHGSSTPSGKTRS